MTKKSPLPFDYHLIWTNPWYFIACGFGSGAIPIAPGTFATLFAIPFYLLIAGFSFGSYLSLLLLMTFLTSLLCEKLAKEVGVYDHPNMNIDEFIGFGFTMLFVKPGCLTIFLGFVLFRFFDILKPFPISWIDEHVKTGFGMILDDILAGLFAAFILVCLTFF